ncbi:MAG: PIN domain-containing protein [Acidobacteriia bacterium]|nr:PIN domain-containing protein [Terriglobia bacterium]
MRAVDTNILVYADREEAPHHLIALRLLRSLATGSEPWVLPWPCIYEFLRVVTHPRVFFPPTPIQEAWAGIEMLLESPSVVLISEGKRHRQVVNELLRTSSLSGNLLHDAHIAALLLEHGVAEILTADDDFRRFPGLKVTNPFPG